MRLQKIIAHAGIASRREAEKMILAGRVKLNGAVITEPGAKADIASDEIEVDGKKISAPEKNVYYLLYKPANCVTTMKDPQGRRCVGDLLKDLKPRVYPVGRLDYDAHGALLITNNGALSHGLAHPRREVKKTYHVKINGVAAPKQLKQLASGVMLEDGPTAPATARLIDVLPGKSWVEIIIHEGRNRQVKRMFKKVGYDVIKLKRTAFGPLTIEDMKPGQIRQLRKDEVAALHKAAFDD